MELTSDERRALFRAISEDDVGGREIVVPLGSARSAISWLEGHGHAIVGFEGLHHRGGAVVLSGTHIADLSEVVVDNPHRVRDSCTAALEILAQWVEAVDAVVINVGGEA